MAKKFIFFIIVFLIFLINTVVMFRAVQGYEFGVPDAAKGIDTESQVKIYDDNEWNDHLGKSADNPEDLFNGDADIIGAKSKDRVIKWEEKKELISFFEDFVLTSEVEVENVPEIDDFNSVFDYIKGGVNGLSDPYGASNPVHQLLFATDTLGYESSPNTPKYYVFSNGTIANTTCSSYSFDSSQVNEKYSEKLDGTVLEREIWYFTTENYDDKPDVKGKKADAPFLGDPRDWYNTYKKLKSLKEELGYQINRVIQDIIKFNDSLNYLKINDTPSWMTLNSTIASQIPSELGIPVPLLEDGGDNLPGLILDAGLNPTGENPLQQGQQGLLAVADLVGTSIPGKFGFLYQLLLEGLPVLIPQDDFIAKIIKEFDIKDENIENAIPGLDPSVLIEGNVKVEENAITLKFEYIDGTVDPANLDNELEDFEVIFTYGEIGTQESVVFKDGNKEFYRKEGLAIIPGFDISIILGVSASAVIGLIFIVMKNKRK